MLDALLEGTGRIARHVEERREVVRPERVLESIALRVEQPVVGVESKRPV
ncbi:MAG: hypothetical protein U0235_09815 [Polyangiaceae bacterium]